MSTVIYFDPVKHKYTNDVGNSYISATTIIGKYAYKFEDEANSIARACAKIGRNPRHPKYRKYKGMSASQIKAKWKLAADKGCAIGNEKHDYLENSVKDSSGFYEIFGKNIKGADDNNIATLYTIEDVINNPDSGMLNLDYFVKTGVKDRYPKIYNIIEIFIKDGWRIYSEVAVFNNDYLISGLIDILFVKGDSFVILDWKTNKDPIVFEAGYWEKNNDDITVRYKNTDKTFKYPLHKLGDSVGNKYALQLSLYAFLLEHFGLVNVQNILCHITHDMYTLDDEDVISNPNWVNKNKVEIMTMPYLKLDVQNMVYDYTETRSGQQHKMF